MSKRLERREGEFKAGFIESNLGSRHKPLKNPGTEAMGSKNIVKRN